MSCSVKGHHIVLDAEFQTVEDAEAVSVALRYKGGVGSLLESAHAPCGTLMWVSVKVFEDSSKNIMDLFGCESALESASKDLTGSAIPVESMCCGAEPESPPMAPPDLAQAFVWGGEVITDKECEELIRPMDDLVAAAAFNKSQISMLSANLLPEGHTLGSVGARGKYVTCSHFNDTTTDRPSVQMLVLLADAASAQALNTVLSSDAYITKLADTLQPPCGQLLRTYTQCLDCLLDATNGPAPDTTFVGCLYEAGLGPWSNMDPGSGISAIHVASSCCQAEHPVWALTLAAHSNMTCEDAVPVITSSLQERISLDLESALQDPSMRDPSWAALPSMGGSEVVGEVRCWRQGRAEGPMSAYLVVQMLMMTEDEATLVEQALTSTGYGEQPVSGVCVCVCECGLRGMGPPICASACLCLGCSASSVTLVGNGWRIDVICGWGS